MLFPTLSFSRKMRFTAVAIALASAAVSFVAAEPIKAVAYLYAPPVSGLVYFSQESHDSPTRVYANLTGLTGGDHGIHIHEFGDLSQGILDKLRDFRIDCNSL